MNINMMWQFPPNLTNAPIGPRDRGIEHYTGHRFESLVRETIQNSLDAQANPGQKPAKVDFRMEELEVHSFNGPELASAIQLSIEALKNKDEPYRQMFRKAVTQLTKENVPTLTITDSSTTGVIDDGDDDCPWAALTRGSGESAKQGNNASGFYGIGKAAAYLITDLRTVLYSTTFQKKEKKESRFMGKAILSGHRDPKGNKVTSEGYLCRPNFISLSNQEIPQQYRLEEAGLRLYIPGYKAPRNWQEEVIRVAIENFFHALIRGELEITLQTHTVNAETIWDYGNLLSTKSKYLLETSDTEPLAEARIDGVGNVTLRLKIHEDIDDNIHDVALVRDAGMMITRNRSKMGHAKFSIPSHWNCFTAVVECISDPDGQSAVRNCESPKHDELDVDRIPNHEDRAQAREALQTLGRWTREEVRKHTEPSISTDPVNATEAAGLLPVRGNNSTYHNDQPNGDSISEPIQRGTSFAAKSVTRNPNPNPNPKQQRQPPKPQKPPMPQPTAPLEALSRAKFRIGGRHGTHGLTVEIPPITGRMDNVQIQAVTEQGQAIALKITKAWSNGKEVKTRRDKITAITPNGHEPVTLEINLQEPVENRRFRLRTAKEKGDAT